MPLPSRAGGGVGEIFFSGRSMIENVTMNYRRSGISMLSARKSYSLRQHCHPPSLPTASVLHINSKSMVTPFLFSF